MQENSINWLYMGIGAGLMFVGLVLYIVYGYFIVPRVIARLAQASNSYRETWQKLLDDDDFDNKSMGFFWGGFIFLFGSGPALYALMEYTGWMNAETIMILGMCLALALFVVIFVFRKKILWSIFCNSRRYKRITSRFEK